MRLVIRADANVSIGTGHVMRCLALAQAWQGARGSAACVASELTPAITQRLQAEGLAIHAVDAVPGTMADAEHVVQHARRLQASHVVLDGYVFGAGYHQYLKDAGVRLLAVDDHGHASHYTADWVLNQNLHASADLYQSRSPHTRLLLGPRFALLRREFARWRNWKRAVSVPGHRVLVTLGGSDPDNLTLRVVGALQAVSQETSLAVDVVLGGSSPHRRSLETALRNCPDTFRLHFDVADLTNLMADADVAVAAGGATSWERALLQLPSVVLVLADNQRPVAEALERQGLSHNLGFGHRLTTAEIREAVVTLLHDAARRTSMAQRSRNTVDGWGAQRVLCRLLAPELTLRAVTPEDCRLLWQWVNESGVRTSAFCPEPVSWQEHVAWFTRKRHEGTCRCWIALDVSGQPVGQIRFDIDADQAEVDVSIDRESRGRGFGTAIISRGVEELTRVARIRQVHARVKPNNQASLQAFLKAGFQTSEVLPSSEPAHVHLVWREHGV